ncbi:tRNA-dihydrouridine synthase A [Catenovulum maritimum]|uniref:tRNA-dihydrouridine(20/20a) synthase n=2 Tax=Catenovulum maritimum TaxID=1513271 RepID=A0A0J8GSD8_9ALTE|nr:tRNA-dihydrouridine synthase A [Catenovulum maritimum]
MLDWTDRHCRYFYRILSKNAVLYTEMVTTGAILYGKGDYLAFNKIEKPVVLQLGGSDPKDMTAAAVKAQEYGYDEVNINVGCPSDRVQNGRFGACLMAEPELVAECVKTMQANIDIPVTVKTRIGIDDFDDYAFLTNFVNQVSESGCNHFIVHARKAWLKGLSPKQNREIPPLDYDRVYQLKRDFPELEISINGGVETIEQAQEHLKRLDGVMLGRAIYQNPYLLHQVDELIYDDKQAKLSRIQVVQAMLDYVENETQDGATSWHIARHMLGLFSGQPRARIWRRYLSENARKMPIGTELFENAISLMTE